MRKYTLKVAVLGFLGIGFGAFAQVGKMGINTDTPNATLDVVAKKGADGSDGIDGFKAPQLTGEELKTMSAKLTADHDGLIVYVTSAVATPDAKTQKVTFPGYYRYTHSRNLGGLSSANTQLPNFLYAEASWVRLEATGLEVIRNPNDYTKVGRRLVGADADKHGGIGLLAVDMSYQDGSVVENANKTGGATGEQSFAIGQNTTASGTRSFAMGENTIAAGTGSIAGGSKTHAKGWLSTVFGEDNYVNTNRGTAFGQNVSIGRNSQGQEDSGGTASQNSFAVGYNVKIHSSANSLAYGENTEMIGSNNALVGGKSSKITNGTASVALGDTVSVDGIGSIGLGSSVSVQGQNSVAIGQNITMSANSAVAIGSNLQNTSNNTVTIGDNSIASASGVAIGGGTVNGDNGVAIGVGAVAGTNEVAIGGTTQTVTLGKLTSDITITDGSTCSNPGKLSYRLNVGFFICSGIAGDTTAKWRKLNN